MTKLRLSLTGALLTLATLPPAASAFAGVLFSD